MMSSISSSVPNALAKQKQYQEMYSDIYQNTKNLNITAKSSHMEPNGKSSRMSISHAKGLLNMPGQNNCFLNSAVQVLWHLDIFRRSFRELSGHACMADSCIFCALKELFNQFQYSQESALPPDALRYALAEAFSDQRRFQLGFMDDAAECFENILLRIHCHIANQDSEEMSNTSHCLAHCIPHQKFAMNLIEQIICHSCGATSEPFPFTQMVHYVSTPALCAQAKQYDCEIGMTFGELLKSAGAVGDIRDCPRSCGARIQIKKSLINKPDIVSIGLVWDSERPTLNHIMDVFRAIGTTLRLPDVFDSVSECRPTVSTVLQLVGLVTYYGKHYSTFFFHTKLREWIYFDDAAVRPIGPHWQQVIDKCIRGHFQPLLLLYANPNGMPVSTENAPKESIPLIVKKNTRRTYPLTPLQAKCDITVNNYHSLQNMHRNAMPSTHITSDSESNISSSDKRNVSNIMRQMSGQNQMNKPFPPQQRTEQTYINISAVKPALNAFMPNHKTSNQMRPNRVNTLQHKSNTQSGSDVPDSPSAMSSVSYFSDVGELDNRYISRKTVESILNLQRHSIKKNAGNRNSSSSLESFDIRNGAIVFNKNHLSSDKPVICSLQRHDSGNSSGDRNSASSASVSSVDSPYYTFMSSKRRPLSNLPGHRHPPSPKFGSDQGYDSFSLSSTDSYPSVNSTTSAAKLNPNRLKQIPEDVQLMELINASTMMDCDKLCSAADVLLLKSHEKEREGDLRAAAALSDSAASRARSAMDAPYSNHQTLITAKMKHSMCVMRSASLHKRLNEMEAEEKRRVKEQMTASTGSVNNHSRQSSRDSTHSKHSRQGSKDGKEPKSKEQNTKHASLELNKSRISDCPMSVGKTLELYATLPKKGSKKKLLQQGLNTLASLRIKSDDSNLYRDVISKRDFVTEMTQSVNKKKVENNKKSIETNKLVPNNCSKTKVCVNNNNNVIQTNSEDFSDYYSEWEGTRRTQQPLLRTLSGSASCRENDSEFYGEVGAFAPQTTAKKQHRVRRKLLMGGFMKRKNRSLPDLREGLKSGTNECPNDMMSELSEKESLNECKTIAQISAKGFHQSHRAFISERGLYQRPSLLKVSPPLIEKTDQSYESVSNIYNSKLNTNVRNQTNHINNNQFSQNNQSACPPTPPRGTSIASVVPIVEVESNPSDKKCVENSFLKELASKRAEIMKASIKDKPNESTNIQTLKELINHGISQNPGPTVKSVLKNSFTKHNMNLENDNNYESINLMPKTPPLSHPIINQMPNSINKSISSQITSPKVVEQTDDSNKTITSVKDLTSKFEKIMNKKEEKNSNEKLNETLDFNESIKTERMDPLSNGGHRIVALMASDKSDELNVCSKAVTTTSAFETNKSDNYSVQSPTTINTQNPISVTNCLTPAVRPNRPPDYQTAMKRIGMLRSDKSALNIQQTRPFYMNASGNIIQVNCGPRSPQSHQIQSQLNESQKSVTSKPITSDQSKQNTTKSQITDEQNSLIRKRNNFKKSVSFSDQVVLVACAEEDQEEYLPNPILEKILGKNNTNFAQQSP